MGTFKGSIEAEKVKELEFVVKLRCFSAKMESTLKKHHTVLFPCFFGRFFEVYSILAEKQRNLTTKLRSLSYFASFKTPYITKSGLI